MSNNNTIIQSADEIAQAWIKSANIQTERDKMYAHSGVVEGYHSRNQEIEELVTHIQNMLQSNNWGREDLNGIRTKTHKILNKYNK